MLWPIGSCAIVTFVNNETANYYTYLAKANGGLDIPPILNGQAWQLGDPEKSIPVRSPESRDVTFDYESVIRAVGCFVVDPAAKIVDIGSTSQQIRAQHNGDLLIDEVKRAAMEAPYIKELIQKRLIPRTIRDVRVITGSIRDVRVRAVAPHNLPERTLQRAMRRTPKDMSTAILMESAILRQGMHNITTASLTLVSPDARIHKGYKLDSIPLLKRELFKTLQTLD